MTLNNETQAQSEEITRFPSPEVRTIAQAALWAAEKYADLPALLSDEGSLSFRDYVAQASKIAASLIQKGIGIGDYVGIWAPNSGEYAQVALGIHLSGAAVVPINTRFVVREVADVIRIAQPKVLFTVGQFLNRSYGQELRDYGSNNPEDIPNMPQLVLLDEDGEDSLQEFTESTSDSAALVQKRVETIGDDDIATVLFTSGTTGRPKGVKLTHSSLVRSYWVWGQILGVRPGDRVILSNPFFHVFGLKVGLLICLVHGAAAYPMAVFDAKKALEVIDEHKITYYPGPPPIFQSILDEPSLESHDIGSLRFAVVGSTIDCASSYRIGLGQ